MCISRDFKGYPNNFLNSEQTLLMQSFSGNFTFQLWSNVIDFSDISILEYMFRYLTHNRLYIRFQLSWSIIYTIANLEYLFMLHRYDVFLLLTHVNNLFGFLIIKLAVLFIFINFRNIHISNAFSRFKIFYEIFYDPYRESI